MRTNARRLIVVIAVAAVASLSACRGHCEEPASGGVALVLESAARQSVPNYGCYPSRYNEFVLCQPSAVPSLADLRRLLYVQCRSDFISPYFDQPVDEISFESSCELSCGPRTMTMTDERRECKALFGRLLQSQGPSFVATFASSDWLDEAEVWPLSLVSPWEGRQSLVLPSDSVSYGERSVRWWNLYPYRLDPGLYAMQLLLGLYTFWGLPDEPAAQNGACPPGFMPTGMAFEY
jgi:hypothetical protein